MKFMKDTLSPPLNKVFILLIILCTVYIAPVMAGSPTPIVEDGVHLVKYDDSPTQIDPRIYHLNLVDDVVIDGDHTYWIRIGNVATKQLTTVWWTKPLAATISVLIFIAAAYCWYLIYRKYFPEYYAVLMSPRGSISKKQILKPIMTFFVPFFCILGLTITNSSAIMALSDTIPHAIDDDYTDFLGSDGTILLKVNKIHPEENTLYAKSGLNLTTLTHIPSYGNNMQRLGGNPT